MDLFRFTYLDAVATTFRHGNKLTWSSLDRWGVNYHVLDKAEVLETVSAAGISDHDAVGIRYSAPEEKIERDLSMYRMSFSFIRQLGIVDSRVRKDVQEVMRGAREFVKIAASYGSERPSGWRWDRMKRDIHVYARQCDEKQAQRWRDKMNAARDLVMFGEEVDIIESEAEGAERW